MIAVRLKVIAPLEVECPAGTREHTFVPQSIHVLGSCAALGKWNERKCLRMDPVPKERQTKEEIKAVEDEAHQLVSGRFFRVRKGRFSNHVVGLFAATFQVRAGDTIRYRFVVRRGDHIVKWESIPGARELEVAGNPFSTARTKILDVPYVRLGQPQSKTLRYTSPATIKLREGVAYGSASSADGSSQSPERIELRWIDKGWVKGGDELRIVFGADNSRPPISISRTAMENLAAVARSRATVASSKGQCPRLLLHVTDMRVRALSPFISIYLFTYHLSLAASCLYTYLYHTYIYFPRFNPQSLSLSLSLSL